MSFVGAELSWESVYAATKYYLFMNFVRYYPIAGAAFVIFYVWKKNYFSRFKIQDKFPQSERIWKEVLQSASTLIVFSCIGVGVYVLNKLGIWTTQVYRDTTMYGGAGYMILSFILITIWHETYFYWAHRLMHTKKLFPYFHNVHHLSTNPTPVAAYNFQITEAFFEAIYVPIFVHFVPIYFGVLIFHTFYAMILNVWFHLGYEVFPRGWASHPVLKWVNTSTHHNLHHSRFHGNYSLYFNFWDRIMGTNFKNYEAYYDEVTARRDNGRIEIPEESVPTT